MLLLFSSSSFFAHAPPSDDATPRRPPLAPAAAAAAAALARYTPLVPSWNPTSWPRFQFNPVMFALMPKILNFFELIRLVPAGTSKTQVR